MQRAQEEEQTPNSSFDPPSSQPIRTAKRHRANRLSELSSARSSQPPAKKPRRAGTAETARFQSVLQETAESETPAREIKDSYEEQSLSTGSGRIRVVVPLDQNFDREAYAKVSVVSSQPYQSSQLSHTSQSSQLSSYNLSQSQHSTPIPQSIFIWGEEDDGLPTVPDSQDIRGSSSYNPTETPTSKTSTKTRPNTGTTGETGQPSWKSPSGSLASAGADSRDSVPLSDSFSARNLDSESEPTSSQVEQGLPSSITAEYSQQSQQLPRLGIPGSEDPSSSFNTDSKSRAPIITISSDLPSSSDNHLPQVATSSEVSPRILKQVQIPQFSAIEPDQSSQKFLTQLPIATQDEGGSLSVNLHVIRGYVIKIA